jgi:hypothetical protein
LPDWVYSPARDRSFSENHCFLCGDVLTTLNRTNEHVFPRWLLEEFDLWDQMLTLINQTPIPYRKLVIPCCKTCNGLVLKPIEDRVLAAYRGGHQALVALDRTTLFLWLGKIFYGLLFREMFLPADRTDLSRGPIASTDFVAGYATHHLLLQAARGFVDWTEFPASIFAFECQESKDRRRNFDFGDNAPTLSIGIRMGHTGFFARLQDFGALQNSFPRKFDQAAHIALHPIQFHEVLAIGIYAGTLFNRTPKLLITEREGKLEVMAMPLAGFAGGSLFDDWDLEHYAYLLAHIVHASVGEVYSSGSVRTWLSDEEGSPVFIAIDEA